MVRVRENEWQIVLLQSLTATGDALNIERCWLLRQSFHFVIADDWSVAITPDTADRLRVELYHRLTRVPGTARWVLPGDWDHLMQVVTDLTDEVNGDMQPVRR